jgi:hypothetical protein
MEFQQKGRMTVYDATVKAFEMMPEIFSSLEFCRMVRIHTGRPMLMDGSILRRLREVRADRLEMNYRCIDSEISLYKKIIAK